MKKANEVLGRHLFTFNKSNFGGEQLVLETKYISTDDVGEVIVNQFLTLNSYCNSATFNLYGAILTPENLRNLANQLESQLIKMKEITKDVA